MNPPADFNPQPPRPAWGVRTPARKSLATREPILVAPPPVEVFVALGHGTGLPATPSVRSGQQVRCGEPLGPGIHASISGQVLEIGKQLVAGGTFPVPCVHIRSDGRDEPWTGYGPRDAEALEPRVLRALIGEAGIVGLGGALFPTARKLEKSAGVRTLLLNGAECEPYISCDDMLLRERADRVVTGGRILLRAVGAERCVIAVKTDMPGARVALYNALAAANDPRLALAVVTAKYPAGGERQLIELVLGAEVPSGGMPADVGCVCQNVGTAAAVADFFASGRPLVSRIVTANGGGLAHPRNIDARIGTPIRDLIALAGGYRGEPRRLIMGGPMMGVALADDELPITPATNCIIAATDAELGSAAPEMPCIRCGECAEACPARLQPQELLNATRRADAGQLEQLGISDCIECGACDYVCPSHIPLTRRLLAAKALVADHRDARARAAMAKQRFEAREERRASEERARETDLARQLPTGSRPGADALQEVLHRVGRGAGPEPGPGEDR